MDDLSEYAEPVVTEELDRLALALYRIEWADELRVKREQGGRRGPYP